jgi:hypothetical protein
MVAVMIGAAACAGSARTTTSPTTSTAASSTTSTYAFDGSTSPTSAAGTRARLTGFGHASQPGAERLVFDFQGGPPGYQVHYVSGHGVAKPSGQLATVAGDAAIDVVFDPAMAHDDQGHPTVSGSQSTNIAEGSVVEAVLVEDFEGYVSFAVGVLGHPAFHVIVLSAPPRIAVDIAS